MNYEKKYLDIIKNIVLSNIDRSEHFVFLFGSRARGSKKKSADVDIGIMGKKPIGKIYYKIINEIEESIVPYKVDVIDFSLVDQNFKRITMEKIVVWNQTIH
jgi:predicted nucleotidyltransferase